ncbi:MAG: hydrogenase expression/formation protein HypE [Chloroflexi bacterium]|nr:hydrogenase expression/formation protein HypE [Chloroflexota bacterium]
MSNISIEGPVCPIPMKHYDKIVMGHGSGGRMTQELIQQFFLPYLSNKILLAGNDFACVPIKSGSRIAVSTDAHVVSPLFFPGGNIGKLAVCGTVNDISMSGAIPIGLTASFILEEGLSTQHLEEIVKSMANTASEAGVLIVAGDTKVVEKGKADGLFITTTGFGTIPDQYCIGGSEAKEGDVVLISGTMGDHGIAVLTARGDLGLETDIESDVAPLNKMIQKLLSHANRVHVLRDPTRGGLATTLNEIAVQSNVSITIDEDAIPIQTAVRTACEMLGFDPLYVANEGKVIVIVAAEQEEAALRSLRTDQFGKNACKIGVVNSSPSSRVLLRTQIGGTRILDTMAGEMLPRIC